MISSIIKTNIRNEKFANALARTPQQVPPVWFMRQAGRYHSHYRKLKEKYSFIELCKNPELAAEVALGPVKEFGFDVSILFSDILFPLEALGMGLEYSPGPKLSLQITTQKDIAGLHSLVDAMASLEFQREALQLTREILPKDVSLIGFLGGPFTLFTYATSGKHDGNLSFPKTQPDLLQAFYDRMLPLLEANLKLQIDGGAELVMIFDTAAGDLDPELFSLYAIEPLRKLCALYPGQVGYYAKGTTEDQLQLLKDVKGLAGFGMDHRFSIAKALKNQLSNGFLQGNFDQSLLFLKPDDLKIAIKNYLRPIKLLNTEERAGFVAGLGHGVLQFTPEESVKMLVGMIREEFND